MVRIGYLNDMDPYYTVNMTGAASGGLKTGVFFYTQALDTQTAVEEARYVLRMVKDYQISYPIAYDVESQYLLDNHLSKQQITDNINAFCKTISDAGYRPVVYANNKWLTNYIDITRSRMMSGMPDTVPSTITRTELFGSVRTRGEWKELTVM